MSSSLLKVMRRQTDPESFLKAYQVIPCFSKPSTRRLVSGGETEPCPLDFSILEISTKRGC